VTSVAQLLEHAALGQRLNDDDVVRLADIPASESLFAISEALTLRGHGLNVSYSRKVFIPLTHLCRDVCHYCTFAQAPSGDHAAFMSVAAVLEVARAGRDAGCHEALFTLGDQPERRYPAARRALAALGFETTLQYLKHVAQLVYKETGLLPHLNPGVMTESDLASLRTVSVSMGLMLESSAERLSLRGGPHFGSPDKQPAARLATLQAAGAQHVAFTSGLLIGIGETRAERLDALLKLRASHEAYGHLQEIIIQNFRAKPGTRMAAHPEPALNDQLWTIAMARLVLGSSMSIQAPPNLRPGELTALIRAGINDWGGVSPVTPDHVNPEAAWPQLTALAAETEAAGRQLVERLALVPGFAQQPEPWVTAELAQVVRRRTDARGLVRRESWTAGSHANAPPQLRTRAQSAAAAQSAGEAQRLLERATRGSPWTESEIIALFATDGPQLATVFDAADRLRASTVGDVVTYVVNRNINYTNICTYHCGFCAFSKGRSARSLRGPAYQLEFSEIGTRAAEAVARGATEVCLQGGIHPDYTGQTYLDIVAAVRAAAPSVHIHAFSPLEISHGAMTLGLPLRDYLRQLKLAGLATLPGTAAEILDDEVRQQICPDKLSTGEWLEVMRAAHDVGLRSTATIMYGHVDSSLHWARHLLHVRTLQQDTGGFTEFVPLPFVHMESPMYRRAAVRSGPTFREALLMHAVARLVLHPVITNIQASWVKLGPAGVGAALNVGVNDLGGTLMDESITRAAGGSHGQCLTADTLQAIAISQGRRPQQRSTLYGSAERAL
jgi:FO synthase